MAAEPIRFASMLLAALLVVTAAESRAAQSAGAPAAQFDLNAYERSRVLEAAATCLGEKPATITSFAAPRSPGGVHDFYSEADYYWPDPANARGPYVLRDGLSYPGLFQDHRRAMWRFNRQVAALTAAYVISGEDKYAAAAIDHLRAWFVEPATRMNPSLEHGQAVVNRDGGNVFGIIDTLHLLEAARSIVVLRERQQLSPRDERAMTDWFESYLTWLLTSRIGLKEADTANNHAIAFWLQTAAFAQVTRDEPLTAQCRQRFKTQLVQQMSADGSFPRELARTRPYAYSLFTLDQLVMLARVASTQDDDLFRFQLEDGRGVRKAVEFMYPFVKDKTQWRRAGDVELDGLLPVRSCAWLYAGRAYGDVEYVELWKSLSASPSDAEVLRNVPIQQPLIWEGNPLARSGH